MEDTASALLKSVTEMMANVNKTLASHNEILASQLEINKQQDAKIRTLQAQVYALKQAQEQEG